MKTVMRMTYIYVDVLLVLNLYVNYFLLKATARMMHVPVRQVRCVLTAALGSLFALSIFLPPMHWALCMLGKLATAAILVRLCFGKQTRLRDIVCFFLISFGFGGGMLALSLWKQPRGMAYNNASLYLDFSIGSLVFFTIAAYLLTCMIRRILDKTAAAAGQYTVVIRNDRHVVSLDGLADTGNLLVDSFSGKSVIVCGRERLGELVQLPQNNAALSAYTEQPSHLRGFRLIPFSTIASGGVLPVFSPDEVLICDAKSRCRKRVDVLIGVNPENTAAIFNPKLLI